MPGHRRPRYCPCGTRLAADNRAARCTVCARRDRERDQTPPDLPPEFWRTDVLHDAFAAQHIGLVSVAYRLHPYHRRPVSQERLGSWLGLTQAQVSRVESGSPVRDLDRLTHWATALKVPPHLLWFDLPGRHRVAPATQSAPVPAPPWPLPSASAWGPGCGERLPAAVVGPALDTIRAATIAFRTADRQLGGGHLYPVVVRYLQTEVYAQLIGHGHQPAAVFSAASSLTDMAGWLAYDDQRRDLADQHFAQAFGLATAAGDRALSAQALVSQSHLALDHDRPADAVRLADAGLALVPVDPVCAELRARLYAMKARGAALLGDEATCAALLLAAERELGQALADGHGWLSHFDEAALAAESAVSLRDLGRLGQAQCKAVRVLTLRGSDRVRSRAFSQLTLATVQLRQGDLDAACILGGHVLDVMPQLASYRVVEQLRALGRSLQPHGGATPVGDFLDRLASVLPRPRSVVVS